MKKKARNVHFTAKTKVHFMGIGGSGLSAVSMIAKSEGFEVSGCDLDLDSSYIDIVQKSDTPLFRGHSSKHLKGVDLLVISPAVEFQNKDHPEYKSAEKKGKLMTWQKFLGKYILPGKKVIAISGTHGKGSTTALASLIFEKAGADPSVLVGAKMKNWNSNYRLGKSSLFILEADEFNDNFLHYKPSVIIINNIEFDHPDYFSSENQVIESFNKFINKLKKDEVLIVNQDSQGVKKLISRQEDLDKRIEVLGYTFEDNPLVKTKKSSRINIINADESGTEFSIKSSTLRYNDKYHCSVPGKYNVANAAGAIITARLFGIDSGTIKLALSSFKGMGRRLDLIGEKRGVKVYDDYAHHPTAVKATISALRQKYPGARIWAIIEAHGYSRTKALLKDYKGAFEGSDKVIVGPIFKARDKQKFGVNGYSIVKASGHNDIKFVPTPAQIAYKLKKQAKKDDVILVMGAGYSYKWARNILKSI